MIKKQNIAYLLIFIFLFFGLIFYNNKKEVKSNESVTEGAVNIYYFWTPGCPYCVKQGEWIDKFEEEDKINFLKFEAGKNSALFTDLLEKFNVPKNIWGGVPSTFIGDEYFIGFSDKIEEDMEDKIRECMESGDCEDPTGKK